MSIITARPATIKPRRPRPITRPRPRPASRVNPRDAWPASADQRWTIVPEAVEDDFRPTATEPTPSPEDESEAAAFDLGYRHIEANPPAGTGLAAAYAWRTAHNLGWLRREHDAIISASRKPRPTGLVDADVHPARSVS